MAPLFCVFISFIMQHKLMKLNVIMHEDQVFKHSHIFQNRLIKKNVYDCMNEH